MALSKAIRRVVVVGTGVIGASWATHYLSRGFDVVATDPAPNAESDLRNFVDEAWAALTSVGLGPGASAARLRFVPNLQEALVDADFVQENGPERADFKVRLFAEMDAAAPADSILASSSSGIPMDVIQSACTRPERCVIGHPFNPPHIVPLVEVVGGAKTSEAAIERALDFYASVLYLVQQGVLSIADADIAVCYGPGLRWGVLGPSLQWHLGGGEGGIRHFAEHLMDSLVDLMNALEMPDITPALKQTLIDGVLDEAAHRPVDQLAKQENEVLLGLLALRDKVGIEGSGHIDWSRAA
jgi:3-hydroxyacyl-CoA dehydrogenase